MIMDDAKHPTKSRIFSSLMRFNQPTISIVENVRKNLGSCATRGPSACEEHPRWTVKMN
jgi:hypothetical protein